jgi:hypothetical protein
MFNFNSKKDDDPQKALDNAKKMMNSGITGGLTKAFMGKDFVNQTNNAIEMGQSALDGVKQQQVVMQTGLDAAAEVVSVTDTGQTVNMNPVVVIQMKVTPSIGAAFDLTTQTMVSRIAVPRAGDKIKIKYNPANPQQIVII